MRDAQYRRSRARYTYKHARIDAESPPPPLPLFPLVPPDLRLSRAGVYLRIFASDVDCFE